MVNGYLGGSAGFGLGLLGFAKLLLALALCLKGS
jgi:hypothetical protein